MLWFKELIHNCLVHPLLPFMPRKWANDFHAWDAFYTWGTLLPDAPQEPELNTLSSVITIGKEHGLYMRWQEQEGLWASWTHPAHLYACSDTYEGCVENTLTLLEVQDSEDRATFLSTQRERNNKFLDGKHAE